MSNLSNERELARLRHLNRQLIELLESRGIDWRAELKPAIKTQPDRASLVTAGGTPLTTEQKIALFHRLFRGRTDVYPVRWENNAGRSGYSPACHNEWKPGVCDKPAIKCSQCPNQDFKPVTDQVIYDHLAGKHVIGVYPMTGNDLCHFLAVDFDEGDWQADVNAFRQSCEELNIPCAVEISRSGNGAHAWIFFSEPVSARQARNLGAAIISYTCAGTSQHNHQNNRQHHRQLRLSSYDRMFPNQDTLPKAFKSGVKSGVTSGTKSNTTSSNVTASKATVSNATAGKNANTSAGLGNLIALPLQKHARSKGASIFVDHDFVAYPDQWAYLNSIKPLCVPKQGAVNVSLADHIDNLIQKAVGDNDVLDIGHFTLEAFDPDAPWQRPLAHTHSASGASAANPPKTITVTLSNLIYLPKAELSKQLTNRLIRIAAFPNPEHYKAQTLRLPVWNKPRIIACAENFPNHIGLPRGCLDAVTALLAEHNILCKIQDERQGGNPIKPPIEHQAPVNPEAAIVFHGKLRPQQTKAVNAMLAHDHGVLCAPTAFGKTVTAASLIAKRGVNTLILVHRTELLEQWKERLCSFLGLSENDVGIIGGGKKVRTQTGRRKKEAATKAKSVAAGSKNTITDTINSTTIANFSGSEDERKSRTASIQLTQAPGEPDRNNGTLVDIAMVQSLARQGHVNPIVERYGHVIVDECHHVSAVSFEQILKTAKAKYVLGLTATPIRRDGLQPIIMMQCGPIRHRASRNETAPMSLTVHAYEIDTSRCSDIDVKRVKNEQPSQNADLPIQTVFQALAQDQARTEVIVNHAMAQFRQGRKVLLLTERTDHLLALQALIQAKLQDSEQTVVEPAVCFFTLHGRLKKSEREAVMQGLQSSPPDHPRLLLATGKLIGEGFDHAPLDTLILGMPISWKGTLQQYVGRLHREHAGKSDILVIDFIDQSHPSLARMWNKRQTGYKALGYQVQKISHEQSAHTNTDGCGNLQQDQRFQHEHQGRLDI